MNQDRWGWASRQNLFWGSRLCLATISETEQICKKNMGFTIGKTQLRFYNSFGWNRNCKIKLKFKKYIEYWEQWHRVNLQADLALVNWDGEWRPSQQTGLASQEAVELETLVETGVVFIDTVTRLKGKIEPLDIVWFFVLILEISASNIAVTNLNL